MAASSCWAWDENWNCIEFISSPTKGALALISPSFSCQLTRTRGQSLTVAFLAIYAQAAPGI